MKQVSGAASAIDPAIDLDDKVPDAEQANASEPKTVGWVTTLDPVDHGHLQWGMKKEPEEIKAAGLFPPALIIERFANYFPPGTPFSYIMLRLHEISTIHPRFYLCTLKDQLDIAEVIHPVKNLSIQDRIVVCAAPIGVRSAPDRNFLLALAECIANGKSGSLLDIEQLPLDVMDKPPSGNREYLYELEQLHKMLVCYLWLSYRFPNVFTTRSLANYTKKLVEDQIEHTLNEFSFVEQVRLRQKKARDQARHIQTDLGDPIIEDEGDQTYKPDELSNEAKDTVNDSDLSASASSSTDGMNEYPHGLPTSELHSHRKEHEREVAKY